MSVSLAPGEHRLLDDVVGRLGGEGSGSLEISSSVPVLVSSRTYNQSLDGSFGQYLDGFRCRRHRRAGRTGMAAPAAAEPGIPHQHRSVQHLRGTGEGQGRSPRCRWVVVVDHRADDCRGKPRPAPGAVRSHRRSQRHHERLRRGRGGRRKRGLGLRLGHRQPDQRSDDGADGEIEESE